MIKFQIITFLLSLFIIFTKAESSAICNCSTFERSYTKVLNRQKRFLIWPKGAAILHSTGFGKQVVAGFPSGFNWILELDMFYALPFEPRIYTQSKDLLFGKNKPKVHIPPWLIEPKEPSYSTYKLFLTPKPTTPMPTKSTQMMSLSNYSEFQVSWNHESHDEEFVAPSSVWKNNIWSNTKHRPNQGNFYLDRNLIQDHDKNSYYKSRGRSLQHKIPESRWENIYALKDRQEFYDVIHKGFNKIGIDTTSCLQRTICEVQHFLLPKGFSLVHDVLRILFSYPIHMNDKWSEAARVDDEEDCSKIFDCPMSFLDFFLHSGHIF